MKRQWYKHFRHKKMFVFKTEGQRHPNNASGWNWKGVKFENEFHFIDKRYKLITDPEQIRQLDADFDKE